MIFARIAVLAVFAVTFVNGAPSGIQYGPTRDEMRKLRNGAEEFTKFGSELEKLPGFNQIDMKACQSLGREQCQEKVIKSTTILFKEGYEPWTIPKIDPLPIANFDTTLPSARISFENVELTGFDTIEMKLSERSVDDLFNTKQKGDNFTVDLTVKGQMRMSLTVGDKEHTFETDFTSKYPDVKVMIHPSCEKFAWRFQECSKNYQISHTFNGKPELPLSNGFPNDIAYQEWYNENVNAVKKQEDELLEKYVKEFVDALYGVVFKIQKKFESSVDGDKIDDLIAVIRQHEI